MSIASEGLQPPERNILIAESSAFLSLSILLNLSTA